MSLGVGFIVVGLAALIPGIGAGMTSALECVWPQITAARLSEIAALCGIPCILIETALYWHDRIMRPLRG